MTQVQVLDAARQGAGDYKVDVSRGARVGRVSSEWFSRPADERYLSLSDLFTAVHGRAERTPSSSIRPSSQAARPRSKLPVYAQEIDHY